MLKGTKAKKDSLDWDAEYFFNVKWMWKFLEGKLGVSKYIFEQLGTEIGEGIFNAHLPLLCEFSASDWAENISCPIRIKSKSAQTLSWGVRSFRSLFQSPRERIGRRCAKTTGDFSLLAPLFDSSALTESLAHIKK